MKKTLLKMLLLICTAPVLKAQQLPQYTQYMINDYAINPAVAGTKEYAEAKSGNRYQWVGITDAPRTYILSVNGPYKSKNVGLGGSVFTDITGPTRRTGLSLSYAYRIKITEGMKLSMALSAGLLQYAVDGSKITLLEQGDNALTNNLESVIVPDFGFGCYLYTSKYYFGFSAPQLIASKIKVFDYTRAALSTLATHFYAMGGYKYNVDDNFKVEPSFLIKFVNPAPIKLDVGVRVIYQDKIWLGGYFRTHDAYSAMIGYDYQQNLTFAYSYDFITTPIKKYSSGTHEVMIGIKFGKVKK